MKLVHTIRFAISFTALTSLFSSCDKHCDIKFRNGIDTEVRILTRRTGYQNQILRDTVVLKKGEEFKIGDCINCSIIDESEIDYEYIRMEVGPDIFEMNGKMGIITYIKDWGGPQDCVVKVIKTGP